MEPHTIAVRLLGGFSVRFGEQTLQSLPPQAVSLLGYLIINRERPQTRDLLAGRFWPDQSDQKAKKRLSNTLWQIKQAAKAQGVPPLLETVGTAIQVTDQYPMTVDSELFEQQLVDFERELRTRQVKGVLTDRLAGVVADYPGEFLSGHYHDWIDPVRDRIKDRYNTALIQLIQLYKSRSEYETALRFASTLVKQDPIREDLHREVMRLHAMLGQISAAERQFSLCVDVLAEDLGVEPSPETVQLIDRIRSDAPQPTVRSGPVGADARPLVGRAQELSLLIGRADELLSGAGGVVLVEGDPGIGKTRLVEEFVDAAEWRGIRTLSAGHTGLSNMRPYETLREALKEAVTGLRGEHLAEVVDPVWLQQAAEVFPELSRLVNDAAPARALRPEEEPTRMGEALARIILAQGGLGPTLILLEDIHWCDEDSMQVLSQLGGRLARSGVLLCLTYRRFEAEQSDLVWGGISKLEVLPSGSRLVISPLRDNEARELILANVGPVGLSGATVSQLVEETNGNPLYVLEAIRNPTVLGAAGDDDQLLLGDLELPAAVVRSLESRVAALSSDALVALQAMATLAEPTSAQVLADVTGLDRRAAIEALALMAERGFISDDEHGVCRFSHEQNRRVVYELMSLETRRSVHSRIYLALAELERPRPEQLAHHARLAGRMVDARQWYLDAAREALSMNAYRTAADHFGQADEAAQEVGVSLEDRARDLLAYEAVLDVLGRRSEQTMLLKRLREVPLPLPVELELVEREVWLLLNTDEQGEAAKLATAHAERARDAGQPHVGLLIGLAVARYRSGDFNGSVESAERALQAPGEPADVIAAETILGKALVDLMRNAEGERYLSSAIANAESIGDDRGKIEALSYQAVVQIRRGRLSDAEQLFTAALQLSRSIGYRRGEAANLANLGGLRAEQGRGGLAIENYNAASEVFGSLGNGRGEAFVKTNAADLYHRLLGDDDTALELASSAAVYFRSVGDRPTESMAMSIVSSIDQRRGKRRLARKRLNDLVERSVATKDIRAEAEVRRILGRIEFEAEDWRAAAVHLDRILLLGEEHPIEQMLPEVLALRANVSVQEGRPDEARRQIERLLTLGPVGARDAHVTSWLCGTALLTLGQEAAAVRQFELADELLSASLRGLPAELIERSWTEVPEHVRIQQDYRRHFPTTAVVSIPNQTSPLGRPLTSDEYVDVTWTISEPSDWQIESSVDQRKARLVRLVAQSEEQGGAVRVADLASALEVSERTIKRDIAELRSKGITLKTRRSV